MSSTPSPPATKWDRSVYLVRGYHKHSYPPPIAYDSQLRHRFAVVLHSYREGSSDALFDADCFLRLTKAIATCIDFDTTAIMLEDLGEVRSFHELSGIYCGADELCREAPTEIYFRKGSELICMEQTEFWCRCGGPDIYADSYTFSYYSMTDRFATFSAQCKEMCRHDGVDFHEVETGECTKQPFVPWYKSPLRLLGRKAW